MASLSGLSVSSLQLFNEDYKPYKGVRTDCQERKIPDSHHIGISGNRNHGLWYTIGKG